MTKETAAPSLSLIVAERVPDGVSQELAHGPERWANFVVRHVFDWLQREQDQPGGRTYSRELADTMGNPWIDFYDVKATFRPTDSSQPTVEGSVSYLRHERVPGSLGLLTVRQDGIVVVFDRRDTGQYTSDTYVIQRLTGQGSEHDFDGPLSEHGLRDPRIAQVLGTLVGVQTLLQGDHLDGMNVSVEVGWQGDSGDRVALPAVR